MYNRLALCLLCLPVLARAQAPLRLVPGDCNWERRPGVTWAAAVRGFSSQYNTTTWSAAMATGEPDVWPRYGDLHGAWAPRSAGSPTDWLEVMFPAVVQAAELWVYETNGSGSVYAISAINPDGSVASLAVSSPERLPGQATQLVVPVEPARLVAGVRIGVSSSAADTYGEVDAVAAVGTRVCSAGQAFDAAASWMRLPPGAAPDSAAARAAGVVWAREVVRRSSDGGRDRSAQQALGAPNVWPRYADVPGAWAPEHDDSRDEFLTLRFPQTAAREVWVYETYGVGGVWMVEDLGGPKPVALWADAPARVAPGEPRLLRIVLPRPRTISVLRVMTSPRAVEGYPMVDAVGLVPAGGAGK